MKKFLTLIILTFSLLACDTTSQTVEPSTNQTPSRIKLVEYTVIENVGYSIISVDGVEYITSRGGIYPLKH